VRDLRSLRRLTAALLSVSSAALVQTGCALVSPAPTWELLKAAGAATSLAVSSGPSHASQTVYHPHPTFSQLCIEFNRDSQVPDLVPAIQAELQSHRIESRVYESGTPPNMCSVWLRYRASMAWDKPPLSDTAQSYLTMASLSLVSDAGQVLSTSNYQLGGFMDMGKWTPVRSKISPVVTALVTGFEN
jgi:hypothetical protein